MLQELLTGEVSLLDALLRQTIHHLRLRSDGSVVGARHPTSVLAVDASLTNEDILNRVIEHVTHVEHTRYIWWRNHYSVRLASIRFARKEFVVSPILIPLALHLGRVIIFS